MLRACKDLGQFEARTFYSFYSLLRFVHPQHSDFDPLDSRILADRCQPEFDGVIQRAFCFADVQGLARRRAEVKY